MVLSCFILVLVGPRLLSGKPTSRQAEQAELEIAKDPLAKCCDEICSVAFSPDGRNLATKLYHSDFLSNRGLVLWDLSAGSPIRSYEGPGGGVVPIKFDAGGNFIVASDGYLWDLRGGKARRLGGDRVLASAISSDGRLIATGVGRPPTEVLLWDAHTGDKVRTLSSDTKTGKALRFKKDGKTLLAASVDSIQMWDIDSGQLVQETRLECGAYGCFAYNEDAGLFAVTQCGDSDPHSIQLLDAGTGRLIRQLSGHDAAIWSIDISPDGRLLISSSADMTIKLWDVNSGDLLATLRGHTKIVRSVVFSPDGKTIASGGGDNEAKIWSIRTGDLIATLRVFKDGNWIAYTPDGYYNCSDGAGKYIRARFGTKPVDLGWYASAFFQPAVVAERLRTHD
jgi:WD40 repeat protein